MKYAAALFLLLLGCRSPHIASSPPLPSALELESLCKPVSQPAKDLFSCGLSDRTAYATSIEECDIKREPPLRSLSRGLLSGFSDIEIREERQLPNGIQTTYHAKLDLRPITIVVASTRQSSCVFDAAVWTQGALVAEEERIFRENATLIASVITDQHPERRAN